MGALAKRRPAELAGIAFYALIAVALVVELVLWPGPVLKYAMWEQLILIALSLDAGHVVLTNFLVLPDAETRQQFPWKSWALLNLAVFTFMWVYLRILIDGPIFWGVYHTIVMAHSIQQALGIALLFTIAADRERVAPSLKRFAYWSKRLLVIQAGFLIVTGKSLGVVAASSFGLCFLLYCVMGFQVWRASGTKRDALLPLMSLGRGCLYTVNTFSVLSHNICRAARSLEYLFIFRRGLHSRGLVFKLAIAAAFAMQLLAIFWVVSIVGKTVPFPFPLPVKRFISCFVLTITITHAAQDWYVFNYNKVISRKMRARIQEPVKA